MAAACTLQSSLLPLKSQFFGRKKLIVNPHGNSHKPHYRNAAMAKFNLYEILGGRGLCNGEQGLQQELKKSIAEQGVVPLEREEEEEKPRALQVSEDAFEKELLGLTGGFPGGELGLQRFIEENPPPKKGDTKAAAVSDGSVAMAMAVAKTKPKPPELPLLLPGMIAIVKNPNNPFYMYCGIVQRITDGKAGVLFEGGNWDRLVTFRLEELERRQKGPPMVNPRSAVLEQDTPDKAP